MSEAEWMASTDPDVMMVLLHPLEELSSLYRKPSERKLRLLGVGCCRRIWRLMTDEEPREAIEVAEKYAEGQATVQELDAAAQATSEAGDAASQGRTAPSRFIRAFSDCAASWAAARHSSWEFIGEKLTEMIREAVAHAPSPSQHAADGTRISTGAADAERCAQANLLRDIFGNPFRPLPPRPQAIAALAEEIYAGAWEKMPLLGLWLQEHGYVDEAEHCLDPNVHHVKGCWVVDWVTGRE